MSKCDCTDSYICELCMPDTIDELATLKARNAALERVAEEYRKFDEEMRNMRSADPTKVREALAALDAEGTK